MGDGYFRKFLWRLLPSTLFLLFIIGGCTLKSKDNTINFSEMYTCCVPNTSVGCLSFHPKDNILVSGNGDGTVSIFNGGKMTKRVQVHDLPIYAIAFSPNGKYIATGSQDKTIKIISYPSMDILGTLSGSLFEVFSLCFSPDGKILASGGGDDFVRIWDYKNLKPLQILRGHIYAIHAIAYAPDGSLLASGCYDDTLSLWDGKTFERVKVLYDHKDQVWSLNFSSNSKLLAAGCEEGAIVIWDVKDPSFPVISVIPTPSRDVLGVKFLKQGKFLASFNGGSSYVDVWKVSSGKLCTRLYGGGAHIQYIETSSDGKLLSAGTLDGTIKVWNVK